MKKLNMRAINEMASVLLAKVHALEDPTAGALSVARLVFPDATGVAVEAAPDDVDADELAPGGAWEPGCGVSFAVLFEHAEKAGPLSITFDLSRRGNQGVNVLYDEDGSGVITEFFSAFGRDFGKCCRELVAFVELFRPAVESTQCPPSPNSQSQS